jgi:hypothetical protein
MSAIFADTFYFIALLSRNDQQHEQAIHFSTRTGSRLLTS